MLYREIIAVRSQIHTKHINTLCGQTVRLLNVKAIGIWIYGGRLMHGYCTTFLTTMQKQI